jgi:hypothetical protein
MFRKPNKTINKTKTTNFYRSTSFRFSRWRSWCYAPRPSPEYSCGKRNPLYPIRSTSFVSIVLYPIHKQRFSDSPSSKRLYDLFNINRISQLTKLKRQFFIGQRPFDSRLYLDISRSFKWKESFIFRYFKVFQVSQIFTCGLSDLLLLAVGSLVVFFGL